MQAFGLPATGGFDVPPPWVLLAALDLVSQHIPAHREGGDFMANTHQSQVREFLDAAELAEKTGTSASTWRHLAATGEVPSLRIGRRRVWRWTDVEIYMARENTK